MYVVGNPKSKAELKRRVAAGERLEIFSPGMFPPKKTGEEYIEGPHYPAPHTWYAKVKVEDGIITKIIN